MGLTRIRAQQISDIDYKQAVRVITLSDITLAGGAPSTVDGVSLTAGDRVLVNGQSNAAQNGLYVVQTLGTGSNGTWTRTSDANENGEIQPGMIVMVTEGTTYADTPWKLVTNGSITIGVTDLTFTENYSLAFGNIVANGTAVVANTVSGTVSFAAGANVSIVGNSTTRVITFDAIGGGSGTPGGANTQIQFNDDGAFGGSADLTWDGSQVAVIGAVTATGNITGGNLNTAGQAVATGNVSGGNLTTAGDVTTATVTASGNVSGGNLVTGGQAAITGNITTGNILTDGYFYANGDPFVGGNYGDSNVVTLLSVFGSNTISTTGNVDTGNLSGTAATFTGLSVSAANLSVLFTDSHATASAVRQFRIKSGPRELALAANLLAGNYNSLTSVNDLAIVITGTEQGNANLAIVPWASATSGIRISSESNVATITVAATTINNTGTVFVTGNVQAANVVSNAAITGTTVTATGNVTGGQLVTTNGLLYQSNQLQSNVTIDSADYYAISYGPYDIPDGLVLTVETNWRVI